MSRSISIDIPDELLDLLGSEDELAKEVKQSLVLDLVRQGRISRAKAAELLEINIWDLPEFLSKYRIPWFDYSEEQMEEDMAALRSLDRKAGV
jgi:predicted HTH domain antitoxin